MSDPATGQVRTGAASPAWQRRTRLLPARVVVLFVLALTLFGGEGYRAVWRHLAGAVAALGAATPSSAALTKARRRVGAAPLAALFARVRGAQAAGSLPGAFRFGLRLVAWDATMLDVPDSPDNNAAFPRPRNGRTGGGFPQVRLLTLIEVGTHAVIDAAFGPDSEQVLAGRVLPALGPGMLLLADRNFPGWRMWRQATATGAHLLWRVKTRAMTARHEPSVVSAQAHRRLS